MESYCRFDVDILRRGCGRFCRDILESTEIDHFVEAITIACMVNSVYRRRFIPEKSIAILPNCGYQPFRRYYAKAIQ